MKNKFFLLIILPLLTVFLPARAEGTISPTAADKHYGEKTSVTGLVAQVTFRPRLVFINFEKAYPDSPFTSVVFSDFTNQFSNLLSLKGKTVEVTGTITKYNGKPEIVLSNAHQLVVLANGASDTGGAGHSYDGYWALHLPGGSAGWLGVESEGDQVKVQMLWGFGSVFNVDGARLDGDKLVLSRVHEVDGKNAEGKPAKIKVTETITVTKDRDALKLVSVTPKASGQGEDRSEFDGQRLPPVPPAPDLSQVKFGDAITLFNGQNLDGWKLVESDADNGWSVRDGILRNDQPERKHYGNLRTVAEFEDFALHAETRIPKDGNSGIYLRGTDEVQVYDSYGKPLDSHNMGAIYSRIKPTASAEKPADEWQTLDITYVKRHATVVLNGVKIIDNQPVLGPTGGALWPEMDRPGPIYLQGDHTGIEYRNLVLRPVLN